MTYKFGDLIDAYVAYQDIEGGKNRPLLCIKDSGEGILSFKITGEEGSGYFKQFRYEIANWKEAGLNKPSYVNLYKEDAQQIVHTEVLSVRGTLTDEDKLGVINHLKKIQPDSN